MADLIDPFLTHYREFPDMNRDDSRGEAVALDCRQAMIEGWLRGELPEDAVLETLLDQGISPDDYAAVVAANVDYVIDSGIRFESNDSGLFLPVSP
jgi:hypothetical protein